MIFPQNPAKAVTIKKGVVACNACPGFRQDVFLDRGPVTVVKQDFLCTFIVHKRSFSFVHPEGCFNKT